jgi:hypothetical protein
MTKQYATNGELVLCENGHPIAHFTKNVDWGGPMQFDGEINLDLDFCYNTKPPLYGDTDVHCDECGALFFMGTKGEMHFHFIDGWR